MDKEFKSGFVSMMGRTNVGKSSIMNALVNEKVAAIANKPQTTRNAIRAIVNRPNSQIIFIDTPGIHKPKSKLGNTMVETAFGVANDVDVILFVIDASRLRESGMDVIGMGESKTPRSFRAACSVFTDLELLREQAHEDEPDSKPVKKTERSNIIKQSKIENAINEIIQERELLNNGRCTRQWNGDEIEAIYNINLDTGNKRIYAGKPVQYKNGEKLTDENGTPVRYEGHHMMSYQEHPEYIGEWKNIQALTPEEHILGAHGQGKRG